MNLVMIPQDELTNLKITQQEILKQLQNLQIPSSGSIHIKNITAKELWLRFESAAQSLTNW